MLSLTRVQSNEGQIFEKSRTDRWGESLVCGEQNKCNIAIETSAVGEIGKGIMEKHKDCIKNIKTVKNEQPNHDSDSDIDSEYTYTDCSESEDSSYDSGFGAGGRKDKIERKQQIPSKEDAEDDPYSCLPLS